MKNITIYGVEYAPVNSESRRKEIVVAHRGFVFMGDVERDGRQIIIHNAKNIRRWGTTYGLGQIAKEGPTSETKLDDAGTVQMHELAVVARYVCEV